MKYTISGSFLGLSAFGCYAAYLSRAEGHWCLAMFFMLVVLLGLVGAVESYKDLSK